MSFAVFACGMVVLAPVAALSCATNGNVAVEDDATVSRDAAGTTDASPADGAVTGDGATTFDPSKVCAQELAYFEICKIDPKDINCTTAKFEAWCKGTQSATDSEQRVRAKANCLDAKHCNPTSLKSCIYETYNTLALTPAQSKLAADYCATCEPGSASCATSHTTYSPAKGPGSIDDLYLAAWELSEKLVVAIDQKCTGPAIAYAGADAGTCDRRFARCAGDLYIDALPDCPK